MGIQIRPRIGVSACLLGRAVRFDGGHKNNPLLVERFSRLFELQAVCPEAELGLGIPRPAIQLRRFERGVRLVESRATDRDLTDAMAEFSEARANTLGPLDGFVFKKDSPSCGAFRVPVFDDRTGQRERNGIGVFAEVFKRQHPLVPVEDEGRLNDDAIRENFLERVYAHYRWRCIDRPDRNLSAFQAFHRRYKLMLMARSPRGCRELGQLVACTGRKNLPTMRGIYIERFMEVMAQRPGPGQHVNVLQHVLGYIKHALSARDKAELLDWFERYRRQQVTRITPMALLQHHLRVHPNDYMAEQYYFSPFPDELMQPV